MKSKKLLFLIFISMVSIQLIQAQPSHRRLFYYHPLTNAMPTKGEQITNTDGRFIPNKGWKATNTNSQLKVELADPIPFKGTLVVDVSNFDPANQVTNLKHQIINLYSTIHPSNNKYLFETDNAWWNIRTYYRYSLEDGKAGFRFQAAPNHIDSRTKDDVMLKAGWDSTRTYSFKVIWDQQHIYCLVNDSLITTLLHENQIRAYRIVLLGRDNLIWGYCGQPGPVYSNLRIYTEGEPLENAGPPIAESVTVTDVNHMFVTFNKAVNQESAENRENYNISPPLEINNADLMHDQKTVKLKTKAHHLNRTYALNIKNIVDRLNQNHILTDTTLAYQFSKNFMVSGISKSNYTTGRKEIGATVYSDRPYTITQLSPRLTGLTWIETANDDKDVTGNEFLTFYVNKKTTIYIAYDFRDTGTLPGWLKAYHLTNLSLESDDTAYQVYEKEYNPGMITLGANKGDTSSSMYLILMNDYLDSESPEPPTNINIAKSAQ